MSPTTIGDGYRFADKNLRHVKRWRQHLGGTL